MRAVTKKINGVWQVVAPTIPASVANCRERALAGLAVAPHVSSGARRAVRRAAFARSGIILFAQRGLRQPGEVAPPSPPPEKRLFTGKERDSETGMDYFGARSCRADIARFTTVDPAMTVAENLVDPQRWNRYAYVRNNPLKYVDPDGRELKWATSLSTSDRERLVKILVDVVRREEGRALVERLAADPQVVEIGARSVGDDSGSGGMTKTLGVINLKGSDLAITLDLGKISSIDPRQDPVHAGGTTTMAHELYHANSFVSAPNDGTSRWLFVAAGDKPSSATGPAEKWAVGLFQAPKVIKKKDAEQIINDLIK